MLLVASSLLVVALVIGVFAAHPIANLSGTPGSNTGVKSTCYDITEHLNFASCGACDSSEQTESDYSYMMNEYHHDYDCYHN